MALSRITAPYSPMWPLIKKYSGIKLGGWGRDPEFGEIRGDCYGFGSGSTLKGKSSENRHVSQKKRTYTVYHETEFI